MNAMSFVLALLLSPIFLSAITYAEEKPVDLKVGDQAPAFSGMADDDKEWKSEELAGKKILVVYFYPADMTGGCTKQACLYRDAMDDFQSEDVEIIGISGDSTENHRHFKEAHQLNFTLLADTDGKIAEAFGVKTGPGFTNTATIGEKEINFARDLMTSRWTFVIDKEGNIAYKNTSVNPTEDSQEVMKVVEKLNAGKPRNFTD